MTEGCATQFPACTWRAPSRGHEPQFGQHSAADLTTNPGRLAVCVASAAQVVCASHQLFRIHHLRVRSAHACPLGPHARRRAEPSQTVGGRWATDQREAAPIRTCRWQTLLFELTILLFTREQRIYQSINHSFRIHWGLQGAMDTSSEWVSRI